MSFAVITMQTRQAVNYIHAEKAANSDHVQRCCVICLDQDLSPESCTVYFFVGEDREKNLFQREKSTVYEVDYLEESYMLRSDIRGSTTVHTFQIQKPLVFSFSDVSLIFDIEEV